MRFVENIRLCNLGIDQVPVSDCTRHLVIHNSMSLGLIMDLQVNGLTSCKVFKIIIYNPTTPAPKTFGPGAGCSRAVGPGGHRPHHDAYKHLFSCNYVKRPKEKRERYIE